MKPNYELEFQNNVWSLNNNPDWMKDTAAEGLEYRLERVVSHQMAHYSDVARMALAYKYGGTYLDLDVIVLRSLRQLRNYIVIENGKPSMYVFFNYSSTILMTLRSSVSQKIFFAHEILWLISSLKWEKKWFQTSEWNV